MVGKLEGKPVEELVFEISEKSGKNESEIQQLIKDKVEKFSGLLTEQGAAFMVGKELGLTKNAVEEMNIKELEEGMKGIDVKGKIDAVFPIKDFERNGKKGKLQSIIISDGEGEIRLTLWNDQVDKYTLTTGSEILVSNGIVSAYNEKKQLGLGFNGEIKILKKIEEKFEKLNDLKGGLQSINVAGKLMRKFPIKEFTSGERAGKLCNFQFGDETALLKATAWNEQANSISELMDGENLEIFNAYTKESMFGVELHLGYNSIVKKSEKEMPSIKEIMKTHTKKKKINELVNNETIELKGKIVEILNGKLGYLVCEKCGKKVEQIGEHATCENCGEVKGTLNAIVSLIVEDDTGTIRTTMFGNEALKLIGMDKESLTKELNEKSPEAIIETHNTNLKNKKICVIGYTKDSKFDGEREFMVKEFDL